jgi:YHS domain-containing protein
MRASALLIVLAAALAAPADETKKIDPIRIPAIVDLNNKTCPVQGDEITGDDHVDWNGVRVRLCCPDCKPMFEKEPEAALEKLGLKVVKDGDKTVIDLANATCPIMNKPAKPEVTGDVDGIRFHFCCEGCDKKVKKDPAAALKKLGYGYIPSVVDLRNAACPMSGKAVKEGVFADHDGIRVHFCCPNCPKAFEKDPAATFSKLGVDPAKLKESTK